MHIPPADHPRTHRCFEPKRIISAHLLTAHARLAAMRRQPSTNCQGRPLAEFRPLRWPGRTKWTLLQPHDTYVVLHGHILESPGAFHPDSTGFEELFWTRATGPSSGSTADPHAPYRWRQAIPVRGANSANAPDPWPCAWIGNRRCQLRQTFVTASAWYRLGRTPVPLARRAAMRFG